MTSWPETTLLAGWMVSWLAVAAQATPPGPPPAVELERDLVGHWPLAKDARDASANGHHAQVHGGVKFGAKGRDDTTAAAEFDGRDGYLEVPDSEKLRLGTSDFSISAWVYTDKTLDDVPGDIVSQYDVEKRRGFHLTLKTNAGVTTNQANFRQLQFGIDNNQSSEWIDCGRPGKAILVFSMCVHNRQLYAGTCEPGDNESGRVYTYQFAHGRHEWRDCGAPAGCNSVTALAEYGGKLYAGVGKYRLGGSALQESKNPNLGGGVFRYEGESNWVNCGQLPGVEAIGGLVVFRGSLYASSLYRPAGFFRYEGGGNWNPCPTPGDKRVEAMSVYNGFLYASSYDGGHVYRFDGATWTDCGQLGENSQTYSFAIYQGRLYVGTWPSGRVYRFEDVGRWTDAGRLGEELEVMGMLVHNGQLIAGTLPLAEVYSYEGNTMWRKLARLDQTPDVKYRRAWTMAEYRGKVFVSTLPSGNVFAFQAGASVSDDRGLSPGWHHIYAAYEPTRGGLVYLSVDCAQRSRTRGEIRESARLQTYADPMDYDLTNGQPLRIGFGANDYFRGRLSDVRLYDRVLNPSEVKALAGAKEAASTR